MKNVVAVNEARMHSPHMHEHAQNFVVAQNGIPKSEGGNDKMKSRQV
jgi:hypothetical protein